MVAVSENSAEAGLNTEPDSASRAVVPVMMVRRQPLVFRQVDHLGAAACVLYLRRFSRSRSKMITFSFIE